MKNFIKPNIDFILINEENIVLTSYSSLSSESLSEESSLSEGGNELIPDFK